jgi:hypothetical protein
MSASSNTVEESPPAVAEALQSLGIKIELRRSMLVVSHTASYWPRPVKAVESESRRTAVDPEARDRCQL